jgi:hypothetical protein
MAIIILRSSLTRPLTNAEIDGNFNNLNAGQTNSVVITGGSIDGVTIGGSAAGAGSFTTLSAANATTLSSTLGVTGATTLSSTLGVTGLVTLSNNLKLAAGTSLLPSVYFSTNTTSGFFSSTSNVIGLAISATSIGTFTSTGLNGMAIGATTRSTGAFTTLAANGNVTLGDADTDTITATASFVTGTTLKSAKLDTNTLALAAYDVDGAAYVNLITLTASNTPTLALTSTGVGSINNMSIGASTRSTGAFTTLDANGNVTLGDADTDTITVGASFVNATVLRSAKTATNTLALAAYDVDGTAYTNLITLTASNTPTLTLTSTGVGSINNMTIGATTTASGAFTSISASTTLNVTGTTTLATSLTGLLKATSGVVAAATAGTDYLVPPSGTSILKANSGGALANASAGTDFIAPYGSTAANLHLAAPDGSAGTPTFRLLTNGDIPKTLTGFSTVTINAAATTSTGFGYATGAGSTGTQATSATTTVVMGKACMTGEITLVSIARAANTTYTFSVTNAAFAVDDHIVVTHVRAGSLGAYLFAANCTVAGTGTFSIRTPSALTEAPVIKFTILRSVTA